MLATQFNTKKEQIEPGAIIHAPKAFNNPNYLLVSGGMYIDTDVYPAILNKFAPATSLSKTLGHTVPNPFPLNPADSFGRSCFISGDGTRMVVPAHTAKYNNVSNSGVLYVYLKTGDLWTLEQTLHSHIPGLDPNSNVNEYAGLSCDISDDGLVIAFSTHAAGIDDGGATVPNAGKVHIFTRIGTIWGLEQSHTKPVQKAHDFFGQCITLSSDGNRVVIGAAGAAYVYLRTGAGWALEQEILSPAPASNDHFGHFCTMSADGSRIAITASGTNTVYVYRRTGTTWTLESTIANPDPVNSLSFGNSLALSGDGQSLVIGNFNSSKSNADAFYLYTYNGTSWIFDIQKISNSNTYRTGASVAISYDGTKLAISSPNSLDGHVLLYRKTEGTWFSMDDKYIPNHIDRPYKSISVAMSSDGDTLIISSTSYTTNAVSGNGLVWSYALTDTALAKIPVQNYQVGLKSYLKIR